MADTKITALAAIATVDPAADVLPIVDISDTSMAATGTTKKVTSNQILQAGGTATLASATITGDLTVDTSTLKVDSTNNRVGICTATPAAELHVIGGANFSDGTTTLRAVSSGNVSFLGTTTTDPLVLRVNNIEQYRMAQLGVFTWSDGAVGTRMTLDSTGLGIGGSPAYKLDVVGPVMRLINSAATADIFITDSGTTNGNVRLRGESNALKFITGGGVSATIDSSGNVGIGVTPSATDSTYFQALELARVGQGLTGAKSALTTSPNSWLSNNSYATYSAGIVWNYAVSQPAAQYRLLEAAHQWYNAPSGTAGNAITFTQAMTLDASGNLLIKKTSVSGSTLGCELTATGQINGASANIDNLNIFNTTAAVYRFYVSGAGTVFATNTVISAISDARLKENVQDIDVGLAAILSLKPRKFDWKAGKGKDIKGDRGFIAQEFETVFPNLIDEWKDPAPEGEAPYKSVRQDLIPVLVKAIQELTARVQTLEAR